MTRTKSRTRRGPGATAGPTSHQQDRSGHQTTLHTRHYRVAAADTFTPWPGEEHARKGHLHAERAERALRAQLAAGETPPVLLVAPEQATPATISDSGRLSGVFAWAPPSAGDNGLRNGWTHRPHVTAELVVTDQEPDPASAYYAAGGSVLVHAGRIRRLIVPVWLAPVAGQLSERYGVRVDVDPTPELPEAPPVGQGMIVTRRVMPDDITGLLTAMPAPDLPPVERSDGYQPPRVAAIPPWDDWSPAVAELLFQIGDTFGLPVNNCSFAVIEYLPGDQFIEHTDYTEDADTWDRTVSFSLLLNEPGQDFEGGELEVHGKPVDLHRGDLLGFTARTPHSVRTITAGRRLVLVAFGEWRR